MKKKKVKKAKPSKLGKVIKKKKIAPAVLATTGTVPAGRRGSQSR